MNEQHLLSYGFYLGPERKTFQCGVKPECITLEAQVAVGDSCWVCHNDMQPRVQITQFPCLNPNCRKMQDVMETASRAASMLKIWDGQGAPMTPGCSQCSFSAWPHIDQRLVDLINPDNQALPLIARQLSHDPIAKAFMVILALLECSIEKDYDDEEWRGVLEVLSRGAIDDAVFNGWVSKSWTHPVGLLELTLGQTQIIDIKTANLVIENGFAVLPVPPETVHLRRYWDGASGTPTGQELLAELIKSGIAETDFDNFCQTYAPVVYKKFEPHFNLHSKFEVLIGFMTGINSKLKYQRNQLLAFHFPHFRGEASHYEGEPVPSEPEERIDWLEGKLAELEPRMVWFYTSKYAGENTLDGIHAGLINDMVVSELCWELATYATNNNWPVSFLDEIPSPNGELKGLNANELRAIIGQSQERISAIVNYMVDEHKSTFNVKSYGSPITDPLNPANAAQVVDRFCVFFGDNNLNMHEAGMNALFELFK